MSNNGTITAAAAAPWPPATFIPMFQNSVLTAGTVAYIFLSLQVWGQIQYVKRKGGNPNMFYLLLWAMFCGIVAYVSNIVTLCLYPDDCIHHKVAATFHGFCTWSFDMFLILKAGRILKGLTSKAIYHAYFAVTLALWLVVVITFIIWNIDGYKTFVVPGVLCAPLFPLELAVTRAFEIAICVVTTTVFFMTLHFNSRGVGGNTATSKKIRALKIKSVASAIFTCSVIIVAAVILVVDATWESWAPYNINLIVLEMICVGCALVYSNKCEIGSEHYQGSTIGGHSNGVRSSSNDALSIVSTPASSTSKTKPTSV